MIGTGVTIEECGAGLLPVHKHESTHACLIYSGSMNDRAWLGRTPPGVAGDLLINPGRARHAIEVGDDGLGCMIVEWPQGITIDAVRRVHLEAATLQSLMQTKHLQSSNPARRVIAHSEIGSTLWRAANHHDIFNLPEWLDETRSALGEATSAQLVSGVARRAGVHRATLTKWFREAYGLSPEKYNILIKLERAATLLLSGVRLAVAASESGFSDQAHMTRAWKRYLGETPKQWLRASATIVQ